uniref:Meiosis-specific kinetochore protein-like isoform X2 n=1 Tax=Geotrypetes seraphini TaxID=260995 RepID=A0A6P8Q9Z7_GEOSA|nr:meiosis-specific kinetochore protein-like isoform X2 [Geotrypetes seraphini]
MADVGSKKARPARRLSPLPTRAATRSLAPQLRPRAAAPSIACSAFNVSKGKSRIECATLVPVHRRQCWLKKKKKAVVETLTKIEESCELNTTYISKLTEQSFQLCVVENANEADENTLHQSCRRENFSERSESPPDSSEGMTLPTGVSSFLLDCLDFSPISETTETIKSDLSSGLSPEEFRGAEECSGLKRTIKSPAVDWLPYKNSTLLESSKALNIDLVSQTTDLSAILDPSSNDNHVDKSLREQLKDERSERTLQVSTIVAGKKVCKLVSAREKTPKQSKGMCPVLKRPVSKDILKSKYIKCKKRVNSSSHLDNEMPSCDVGRSQTEMSNNSAGVITQRLHTRTSEPHKHKSSSGLRWTNKQVLTSTPFFHREDLVMDLSPVCTSSLEDELIVNTTGPFVCSSEIVPVHLSRDEFIRYQALFKTLETCSVIRTPESHDPHCPAERFPVDENVLALMKKLPTALHHFSDVKFQQTSHICLVLALAHFVLISLTVLLQWVQSQKSRQQ